MHHQPMSVIDLVEHVIATETASFDEERRRMELDNGRHSRISKDVQAASYHLDLVSFNVDLDEIGSREPLPDLVDGGAADCHAAASTVIPRHRPRRSST